MPPLTTLTLKERVKASGTVEVVRVRFYLGQAGDLQIRPSVERTGQHIESLVTYPDGGAQYLAGDDDRIELDTKLPVGTDDEIRIDATNVNVTWPYTVVCEVIIDYEGGKT